MSIEDKAKELEAVFQVKGKKLTIKLGDKVLLDTVAKEKDDYWDSIELKDEDGELKLHDINLYSHGRKTLLTLYSLRKDKRTGNLMINTKEFARIPIKILN